MPSMLLLDTTKYLNSSDRSHLSSNLRHSNSNLYILNHSNCSSIRLCTCNSPINTTLSNSMVLHILQHREHLVFHHKHFFKGNMVL